MAAATIATFALLVTPALGAPAGNGDGGNGKVSGVISVQTPSPGG